MAEAGPASKIIVKREGSPLGQLGDVFVRPWVYWLFHSWRLFGYSFLLPPLLAMRPRECVAAMLAYGAIHRKQGWQRAVHSVMGYGASRRHRFVNPSAHLISKDKRYLWCLHPHGVLADGWHSIIARQSSSFEKDGGGPCGVGRNIALCFAPVIQHVPVHQEMYRDKCGAADKKSIVEWWRTEDTDPALIPGGFAESVFANAAERQHEYSYIKDRKGFVRICIEEGKDIVPCYTFRANWMYHNPSILRGLRARWSQKCHIGFVPFVGWLGTSMPLTDKTTTVVFPPFEASKYQLHELDVAHAAYMDHLRIYFDKYKGEYGMKDVKLIFVGGDFVDDDIVARGLKYCGLLNEPNGSKRTMAETSDADKAKKRINVLSRQFQFRERALEDNASLQAIYAQFDPDALQIPSAL
jgi:hypothetical protein